MGAVGKRSSWIPRDEQTSLVISDRAKLYSQCLNSEEDGWLSIGLMIASLLSEENRWVDAQRIEVSGGMSI